MPEYEYDRDPVPALKKQLVDEIVALVVGFERYVAGSYLKVDGARVSDLRRGNFARFSVQQLIRMLTRLGRRVTLVIEPTGELPFRKPGEMMPLPPHRRRALQFPTTHQRVSGSVGDGWASSGTPVVADGGGSGVVSDGSRSREMTEGSPSREMTETSRSRETTESSRSRETTESSRPREMTESLRSREMTESSRSCETETSRLRSTNEGSQSRSINDGLWSNEGAQ